MKELSYLKQDTHNKINLINIGIKAFFQPQMFVSLILITAEIWLKPKLFGIVLSIDIVMTHTETPMHSFLELHI